MATHSLALTFDQIRERIGDKWGYGDVITDWSEEEARRIERIVQDGVDWFLNGSSYDWSFLRPVATLTIPTDSNEVVLPAEFGYALGDIFFESNIGANEIAIQNAGQILLMRQQDENTTGRPQYAAIDTRAPGETHTQRSFLMVWPTTDQAYTVSLRYSVLAEALSTKNPYPYGGPAHSQTILQACLAKAEQRDGMIGVHTQLYQAALEASKDFDRRVKAQTLGNMAGPRYLARANTTYVPTL